MTQTKTIRIFASSPGDVQDERNQLARVVEELNTTLRTLVPEKPINVELIRWETHTHPDAGQGGAQDVVDRQIGDDYEIFFGVMWSRFGTPTATAGSGTEKEFRDAYRGWDERRRPEHVLFYFCEQDIPQEVMRKDPSQFPLVVAFREEVQSKALTGSYESRESFADTVRPHLVQLLGKFLRKGEEPSRLAERRAEDVSESDRAVVGDLVAALASEYEETRAAMDPGDERTRRLEVVASKMRTMAQSVSGVVPRLVESDSPGERLAAVTALQAIPDARYVSWLAERIPNEKPFIGYHAAVALVAAARDLPSEHLPDVEKAVKSAQAASARLRPDADRVVTLGFAEEELRRRTETRD